MQVSVEDLEADFWALVRSGRRADIDPALVLAERLLRQCKRQLLRSVRARGGGVLAQADVEVMVDDAVCRTHALVMHSLGDRSEFVAEYCPMTKEESILGEPPRRVPFVDCNAIAREWADAALESNPAGEAVREPPTSLVEIARRVIHVYLRTNKVKSQRRLPPFANPAIMETLPCDDLKPEELIDFGALMEKKVSRLPLAQRTAVQLHVEGASVKRISGVMRPSTYYDALGKAIQTLRDDLEEEVVDH